MSEGLTGKYDIRKRGTTHLITTPTFVLRYDRDPHARVALRAYAESCEGDNSRLAADLYRAAELAAVNDPEDSATEGSKSIEEVEQELVEEYRRDQQTRALEELRDYGLRYDKHVALVAGRALEDSPTEEEK